jgi:hypothetical protein
MQQLRPDAGKWRGFEPMTFNYESMSRAWFKRLVKSERPNFCSGTEAQITVVERYRRLIV